MSKLLLLYTTEFVSIPVASKTAIRAGSSSSAAYLPAFTQIDQFGQSKDLWPPATSLPDDL